MKKPPRPGDGEGGCSRRLASVGGWVAYVMLTMPSITQ